jgi:hypothetical protein
VEQGLVHLVDQHGVDGSAVQRGYAAYAAHRL